MRGENKKQSSTPTKHTSLDDTLAGERAEVVRAVSQAVRQHVADLQTRGVAFYGYALACSEAYGIVTDDELAWVYPAHNGEADLAPHTGEENADFYRYCVDEWGHRGDPSFEDVGAAIRTLNRAFRERQPARGDDDDLDHAERVYRAVLAGLEKVSAEGIFGAPPPFLLLWIPSDIDPMVFESVRRLNSREIADAFDAVLGEEQD
ncbi:MAG: DUF4303 domain-containing protein [Polyangiaceae bacterium]